MVAEGWDCGYTLCVCVSAQWYLFESLTTWWMRCRAATLSRLQPAVIAAPADKRIINRNSVG